MSNPITVALEEEFERLGHKRPLDQAERAAVHATGPDAPLTPLTSDMVTRERNQSDLNDALDEIERAPYWAAIEGAEIERIQSEAVQRLSVQFAHPSQAEAEWACAKIAEADALVADMLLAYETLKAEWASKIAQVKRRAEMRLGLFTPGLEAFAKTEIKGKKKSTVCGPRVLQFTDRAETVLLGDKDALLARIKAEDPLMAEGRLRMQYVVADLAAEKERAIERIKTTGEVPDGFAWKPAAREFAVRRPVQRGEKGDGE